MNLLSATLFLVSLLSKYDAVSSSNANIGAAAAAAEYDPDSVGAGVGEHQHLRHVELAAIEQGQGNALLRKRKEEDLTRTSNVTNTGTTFDLLVPVTIAADESNDDEDRQWPLPERPSEVAGERRLSSGYCSIFADDSYFHPTEGKCYNLGGTWWNDKVTWIRASDGTCIDVWEHHEGGVHERYCGSDWKMLGSNLSRQVSRVCCPSESSSNNDKSPVNLCTGNGGACGCGISSAGNQITMNRYWGDNNDEKVWGCGGAFRLDGASWNAQWGGTLSESGPEASVLHEIGVNFKQDQSFDGWEGCCWICGVNLQIAGKISDGWYCEKDFFSTGIWLKGVNN